MTVKYYFDTCIWRDYYEDRIGFNNRPLGKYASDLILKILSKGDKILFSDFVVNELSVAFGYEEIKQMFGLLSLLDILQRVEVTKEEYLKAKILANKRKIPTVDVLHAIVARNNGAIVISQDNHFLQLKDLVDVRKPEDI
ncbi:MAG: PIN domain-containing protein [Candidatus Woesearchaeota archaeon]|jgi:predicted nucleic acid-binding protein